MPFGAVDGKELSVDCRKLPDAAFKNKKPNQQERYFFWPSLPQGHSGKLQFCPGGATVKGKFGFGEQPSNLMQTGNKEIYGEGNSFQSEENGNSECPFLRMK